MSNQKTRGKPSALAVLTTPLLLRHLLQDNAEESAQAGAFLDRIVRGEHQAFLSPVTVFEAVTVLETHYHMPKARIRELFLLILSLPGLVVPEMRLIRTTLDHYVDYDLEYADASLVTLMQQRKISRVASDNPALDRIPGIRRLRAKTVGRATSHNQ